MRVRRRVVPVVAAFVVRVVQVLAAELELVVQDVVDGPADGGLHGCGEQRALGVRVGVLALAIRRVSRKAILVIVQHQHRVIVGPLAFRGGGGVVRERLGVDEDVAGFLVFRHRREEGLGRRGARGVVVAAALGDGQRRPSRHTRGSTCTFGVARAARVCLGRPDWGRRRGRRRAGRRNCAGY